MADIRSRLLNWWQVKSGAGNGPDVHVSPDMLHLFRLRREHRLLRLRFGGIKQDFQSLLLEVDLKARCLLLDAPFPSLADSEVFAGQKLDVASIEGAAATRFETRVHTFRAHQDASALVVALPDSVTAAQRRNHFRLPILEHTPIQAMVRLDSMGSLNAQVLDLSSKGVRLTVPGMSSPGQSSMLPLLLRLGDERGMLCTLRVCSQQPTQEKDALQLGGELVGLNPPQIQQIERFIARIQRQQRQRDLALAH